MNRPPVRLPQQTGRGQCFEPELYTNRPLISTMPASPHSVLAAVDRSTSAGPNWLEWLASNGPAELLVVAALTLVAVSRVERVREGRLSRRLRLFLAGLTVAGAVSTAVVLVTGLRTGGFLGPVVKLGLASVLWCVSLAVLWRYSWRREGDGAPGIEDLDRLRLLAAAVTVSEDGVMIAEAGRGENRRVRIVFANPAFERMTGYSCDEAVGLSPSVLADAAEPETLDQIRATLRGTTPARLEVPGRRKDGSQMSPTRPGTSRTRSRSCATPPFGGGRSRPSARARPCSGASSSKPPTRFSFSRPAVASSTPTGVPAAVSVTRRRS
jgi:PAS domain S-box-containing protein